MLNFFSVISAFLLIGCHGAVVPTKYGLISGTFTSQSRNGTLFHAFKGIQYAVISQRFAPSVPPTPWDGVKPATEYGPVCYNYPPAPPLSPPLSPQEDEEVFNENCLYLNVFTPTLNGSLPVMVYLHGGSFQSSHGGRYGPNYLMDEPVVYVTFNYRLGILGFLSTEDAISPGNYGLKDQVMALHWVRENIANFGGNPNLVTIIGNSAGGASSTYHLVSPLSRGLFHRATVQSGTFLDPWAFTRRPQTYARKLATHFNCSTENNENMIACLRHIPAETLAHLDLANNLTVKFFADPFAAFGPTIEPEGNGSFLSESPLELLTSGRVNRVPVLAGLTREEGIFIWSAYLLFDDRPHVVADRQNLEANWTELAPAAFYFDEVSPPEKHEEIAKEVAQFYFGDSGFSLGNNDTFPSLSRLYSERLFVTGMIKFINAYAKHSPIYPYLYTFNKFVGLEFGWEELHQNFSLSATHSAELDMLVSPLYGLVRVDPDHDRLSRSMVKLWASFAREGYPKETFGNERIFPMVDLERGLENWYMLDMETKLVTNIFKEGVEFWEGLGLADTNFTDCYCHLNSILQ